MVAEKVRLDSLQPGTSVLPLVNTCPLLTGAKVVPLLSQDNICLGYIAEGHLSTLKKIKYVKYTKLDRVRVLKLKGTPTKQLLSAIMSELSRKGVSFDAESDSVEIFSGTETKAICSVPRSLTEVIGAQESRVVLIAHMGRDRGMSLLMGRRLPTAINNPSKLQCLLSFSHSKLVISREELAEVAYKSLELQPAFYSKLKSADVSNTMLATERGIQRLSTHCYELDLTEIGTLKPNCPPHIEQFEAIPIKAILDSCHAGMVCQQDIPSILSFCIRHGIITPDTEDGYVQLVQVLSYDILNPFPFYK